MMRATTLAIVAVVVAYGMQTGAGAVSVTFTADTPTGLTSVSRLATPLLGGVPGYYWGSIPASDVNTVCSALVNEGVNAPITATVTAYGVTHTYNLQLTNIGGCGASSAAPAGVQAVLRDMAGGRKLAMMCGNYMDGGLDATTPVDSCAVYLTGADITQLYNQLSGGRKRALQTQDNCASCAANCQCVNVVVENTCCCFPAHARVTLKDNTTVRMDELRIGDAVLTIDRAGKRTFEEVYMFGHNDAAVVTRTITLTAAAAATNATRRLQLTPRHFVPTITRDGAHMHKYARDVVVGDVVAMIDDKDDFTHGVVVDNRVDVAAVGAFNPYTQGGYLVVDGVLASAHSDFILDDITPRHLTHLLPHVYQMLFKPMYGAYHVFGKHAMTSFSNAIVPHINAAVLRIAAVVTAASK